MIELKLPYPPNVNHYKKVGALQRTSSGKLYQPRVNTLATQRFYIEVYGRIRAQGLKSFNSATLMVQVSVYPPDKRKRDLDGILKVLLDSLQRGGLFDDDYQIARLLVERKDTIPGGQVVVKVSEIENEYGSAKRI